VVAAFSAPWLLGPGWLLRAITCCLVSPRKAGMLTWCMQIRWLPASCRHATPNCHQALHSHCRHFLGALPSHLKQPKSHCRQVGRGAG